MPADVTHTEGAHVDERGRMGAPQYGAAAAFAPPGHVNPAFTDAADRAAPSTTPFQGCF